MSIGPVDVVVADFPTDELQSELASILGDLVSSDAVRIFDLAFVRRDLDGGIELLEVDDLGGELKVSLIELEGETDSVLSDEDLRSVADQVPAGHTAVVVAWENTWAARMAEDVRNAGGSVIVHTRIPADVVDAALADLAAADGRTGTSE